MPVWRCPHCATPQAESARCWVCRRSTTSCATCRHFRRGVASGLGLCGLDPRRVALRGTEMRACWTAPDPAAEAAGASSGSVPGASTMPADEPDLTRAGGRRARTFVPVDEPPARAEPSAARPAPAPPRVTAPAWSLWGDLEA